MYQTFLLSFLYKDWRTISEEEAARTSFYGLRGWLLLFYVITAGGAAMYLVDILAPSQEEHVRTFGDRPIVIKTLMFIYAAAQMPFLILAPLKHRLMPKMWLAGIWIPMVVYAAALDMPGQTDEVILRLSLSLGGAALMTWYVLRSKRVNVTYLHRVPAEMAPADHSSPESTALAGGKVPKPAIYQRAQRANRIFWGLATLLAVAIVVILLTQ